MTDESGTGRIDRRAAARAAVVRALPPIVLVLIGLLLALYGAAFHSRVVLVEEEAEPLPPLLMPDMPFPFPQDDFPGIFERPGPELVETVAPEPQIVRDVTIGGLERLDTGELKRTYSGEAPSLCPT